jgi:tripartite-type tricarboxylate transporter receptor subunit TctC
MSKTGVTLCVLLTALLHTVAFAQSPSAWPRHTITLIVPNQAGGAYDAAARPLAQTLAQNFGEPIVVDNRPAGSGIVGVLATAKAAPDGYTLLFTGQGQISLYPILRASLPYEPQKDLEPIIRVGSLESFLMVHPSLPVHSVKELFDLAKSKPDDVTFGTWGNISSSNMFVEYLKKTKGISFFAVPYKSAAQALNAGVAGEVKVTLFGQGQSVPLIKAGKLRALAATGGKRSSFMHEIPTLKESGTGFDLETSTWVGLFAPAGTPKDIVARVNRAVGALLADRRYTDKALLAFGFQPDEPNSADQFAAFLRKDRQTYAELIKVTGIRDE